MSADPTAFGKALCSDLKGVWHYRVQNYRIL
jgi:mRNA-degrading endonuclease RelE of RelBE toxin-antitoxin system